MNRAYKMAQVNDAKLTWWYALCALCLCARKAWWGLGHDDLRHAHWQPLLSHKLPNRRKALPAALILLSCNHGSACKKNC